MRLGGNGGHGKKWNEARGHFNVSEPNAEIVATAMNKRLVERHEQFKEEIAYYQALREGGLDDATINEKQLNCLQEAGLDWETVRAKQIEFAENWRRTRNNS